MKKLILSVLVVFAITTVVVSCGTSDTSSSGNTELGGTWTYTAYATDSPDSCSYTFTFNDNNWEYIYTANVDSPNPPISYRCSGTFTLDSTANPKTIDLLINDADNAAFQEGTTWLCLYMLNGDSLTIASAFPPGAARPTSLTDSLVYIKQ